MTHHTLSPTEEKAITRKAHATLKLSCDLKPDAVRQDLARFNQHIVRLLTTKRIKHCKLVLVEFAKGDE